jgi:hypothetical protein
MCAESNLINNKNYAMFIIQIFQEFLDEGNLPQKLFPDSLRNILTYSLERIPKQLSLLKDKKVKMIHYLIDSAP